MFKLPSDALFQHLNVDVYELFKKLFYFGNHYCDSKLALQTKVLFCQKADGQNGIRLSAFICLSAIQNPQKLCAPCPDDALVMSSLYHRYIALTLSIIDISVVNQSIFTVAAFSWRLIEK